MKTNVKKSVTLTAGIALAAVFLWLALRDTDGEAIIAAVGKCDPRFIALVLVAFAIHVSFKALRWMVLISPIRRVRFTEVVPATVIGYLANMLFPAYLGEFARAYIISRQLAIRYTPVLASVVVERMFDFFSVLVYLAAVSLLGNDLPVELLAAGYIAAAAGAALLGAAVIVLYWAAPLMRCVEKLAERLPVKPGARLVEQMQQVIDGLQSLRSHHTVFRTALLSLLQWGAMGICVYFAIAAVVPGVPVAASFVVLALTAVGMSLPSSPGFFGTIQLCFVIGLASFAVSKEAAFAASIFYHASLYLGVLGAGLWFLHRSGFSLRAVRAEAKASNPLSD